MEKQASLLEPLAAPVNLLGPVRLGASAAGISCLLMLGGRAPFCRRGFGLLNKLRFDANSLLFNFSLCVNVVSAVRACSPLAKRSSGKVHATFVGSVSECLQPIYKTI